MIKVLSCGENPLVSTGYGQVWDNLLRRWAKDKPDWEFKHIGWQTRDRPHMTSFGYQQLPNKSHDAYAWGCTANYLIKEMPDIFVTLCDVGYQSGYMAQVFEARKSGWKGKWVAYTPIDSHKWEHFTWHRFFEVPDVNVAMAKWGEETMKRNNVERVKYIPHGVDLETFYPKDKQEVKQRFNMANRFVAGFVGKNQRRKMIDVLLKAWKNFAEGKDDVTLILHTDQEPIEGEGWSIPYMLENYGLVGKVKLTKTNLSVEQRQDIQPTEINDIYNVMDVFAFPTGGEGFGLPLLECQATGVPPITTRSTTGIELTNNGDHGWLVDVLKDKYGRSSVFVGTNSVEFSICDDIQLAATLNEAYLHWKKNTGKLEEERMKSIKFSSKYSWDNIAKQWTDMFEEIL